MNMKLINISFLLILIITFACKNEAEQIANNMTDEEIRKNTEKLIAQSFHFKSTISVKNSISDVKDSGELHHLYIRRYHQRASEYNWREVDKWIQKNVLTLIGEGESYSEDELQKTLDIQSILLDFIDPSSLFQRKRDPKNCRQKRSCTWTLWLSTKL